LGQGYSDRSTSQAQNKPAKEVETQGRALVKNKRKAIGCNYLLQDPYKDSCLYAGPVICSGILIK